MLCPVRFLRVVLLSIIPLVSQASAAEPLLKSGDTLALVGGTLIERMQSTAALENELQCRRPDWKLRVRNLGWSGDDVHGFARKVFETDPQRGLERLIHDLQIANPTVVLVAYGSAEASDGRQATATFAAAMRKLVTAIQALPSRVILMKPVAVPGVRTPDYAAAIEYCGQVIDVVAGETGAGVLTANIQSWNDDKLIPSDAGYQLLGKQLADDLVGGTACQRVDTELDALIVQKNELFFHRHRPQNETYLLLFRKHEQGNNAVELAQFVPLIDALDKQIWDRAAKF